ncbi:MAG: hypothetical protein COV45_07135 [Deltaproteobacteria bacterium CG11_big_fil_rev_8_21_14_0_20_47_16]|nr:MAG: hypothetical protein COV45_07135 [Deltaproteobacteria bacterium CG11_big_fil_rev_8_21_14_0_20_47_16]
MSNLPPIRRLPSSPTEKPADKAQSGSSVVEGSAKPVDVKRAAQVIQLHRKAVAPPAARVDIPSARVVALVTNCIAELFPMLRGAVRQEMVSQISRKVAEDPYARRLLSQVG